MYILERLKFFNQEKRSVSMSQVIKLAKLSGSQFVKSSLFRWSHKKKPDNMLGCLKCYSTNAVFRNESDLVEPRYKKFSYAHSKTNDLHLLSDTIGDRLEAVSQHKSNQIGYTFCMTQVQLKYGELKQQVDAIAQNLLNMGFQKGDRLAIMLPNVLYAFLNLTYMFSFFVKFCINQKGA